MKRGVDNEEKRKKEEQGNQIISCKSTKIEVKTSLEGFSNRFKWQKKRIS